VKQVKRTEAEDVYTLIPHSLAYKPSDDFIEWFRRYFTTTIAGDMDVMSVEFAIESLAMRGLRLPHHCVIYYGKGGNAKGSRSRLRAKAFGAGHKWVSPGVFDKAVRDEFRKQGHEFYGSILCAIREADAFEFDEKVFRAWSAGEGVACRLPHAVHTPMLEWEACGKFWEMNATRTPKILSIRERSSTRRLIGVRKSATYTTDIDQCDASSLVFEADDDLEEKLDTGDAVWCYYRKYLIPWQQKNTPAMARRRITHPPPGLQAQTDELIKIIAENQSLAMGEGQAKASTVSAEAHTFTPEERCFKLLKKSHEEWQGQGKSTERVMNKAQWIEAASNSSGKRGKQSRSDVFTEAMGSRFNFFFDPTNEDSPAAFVAPFTSIEPYLRLPAEQFGCPNEWIPFVGMSRFSRWSDHDAEDTVFDAPQRPDSDDEDVETLEIKEIGHLPSLREYQNFDIDRRPETLTRWIEVLADGTSLGEGWYEVSVPHLQSHGLPGRFLPRPRASLAQLTKEGRTVSVEGRLQEHDFPISHWKSFARLLEENNILGKYKQITKYVEHYQAWRGQWGKQALTALGYGGVPEGEGWNPRRGHCTRSYGVPPQNFYRTPSTITCRRTSLTGNSPSSRACIMPCAPTRSSGRKQQWLTSTQTNTLCGL